MKLKKYKIIRHCAIVLITIIVGFNLIRFSNADGIKIAKINIDFKSNNGEVFSDETKNDEEYNCYAIIKISSSQKINGLRFKLYYNKAFKIVAIENLTNGGSNQENAQKGMFAMTFNNPKDFSKETEIYKVYFRKKLKSNNIDITKDNVNLYFDFADKNSSEIVTEESRLLDTQIEYQKGNKEDENQPDNPSDSSSDNDESKENNGENSENGAGGNNQTTNTVVKDDGTTITTIVDEKAGTITTITTDGKTGEETKKVEKISSSTANKRIPQTGDSISIISLIAIIALIIIAIISKKSSI